MTTQPADPSREPRRRRAVRGDQRAGGDWAGGAAGEHRPAGRDAGLGGVWGTSIHDHSFQMYFLHVRVDFRPLSVNTRGGRSARTPGRSWKTLQEMLDVEASC